MGTERKGAIRAAAHGIMGTYEPVWTVVVKGKEGRPVDHAHICSTVFEQPHDPVEVAHSYNHGKAVRSGKHRPKVAAYPRSPSRGCMPLCTLPASLQTIILRVTHIAGQIEMEGQKVTVGLPEPHARPGVLLTQHGSRSGLSDFVQELGVV